MRKYIYYDGMSDNPTLLSTLDVCLQNIMFTKIIYNIINSYILTKKKVIYIYMYIEMAYVYRICYFFFGARSLLLFSKSSFVIVHTCPKQIPLFK